MKGLCKRVPLFGGVIDLFGSTSVENCLRVVKAGVVFVEYGLVVAIERRLFMGVEARKSGRCGRWPSAPATALFVAMLSEEIFREIFREALERRTVVSGEVEDWSDCRISGTMADVLGNAPKTA